MEFLNQQKALYSKDFPSYWLGGTGNYGYEISIARGTEAYKSFRNYQELDREAKRFKAKRELEE